MCFPVARGSPRASVGNERAPLGASRARRPGLSPGSLWLAPSRHPPGLGHRGCSPLARPAGQQVCRVRGWVAARTVPPWSSLAAVECVCAPQGGSGGPVGTRPPQAAGCRWAPWPGQAVAHRRVQGARGCGHHPPAVRAGVGREREVARVRGPAGSGGAEARFRAWLGRHRGLLRGACGRQQEQGGGG